MAKAGFEHQTQKTIIQVEFKGHGRCFVDVGRRVAKMCWSKPVGNSKSFPPPRVNFLFNQNLSVTPNRSHHLGWTFLFNQSDEPIEINIHFWKYQTCFTFWWVLIPMEYRSGKNQQARGYKLWRTKHVHGRLQKLVGHHHVFKVASVSKARSKKFPWENPTTLGTLTFMLRGYNLYFQGTQYTAFIFFMVLGSKVS